MKLVLVLSLLVLAGCTRVNQGQFGIIQHWGGSIDDSPASPGFTMTILDSVIPVDSTEVRVSVDKIQPKDRDNVLLTASITATYRINPDKAIGFYKQTHEMDQIKENTDVVNVLGYQIMEQEINNSAMKAFSNFQVTDLVPKKMELEANLKDILQKKIDARYADAFFIVNVNVNETRLGEAVEQVLQAQAIAKSQRALLDLQMLLAEKETDLLNRKFEGMKVIAGKAGVSVQSVMDFKLREQNNVMMSELAKNHTGVQVQVPVSGGK